MTSFRGLRHLGALPQHVRDVGETVPLDVVVAPVGFMGLEREEVAEIGEEFRVHGVTVRRASLNSTFARTCLFLWLARCRSVSSSLERAAIRSA